MRTLKKGWRYILVASVFANIFFAWRCFSSEDINRMPPWHPFELNSELNLESIVQDDYHFVAMPCGQVQYAKEFGDTYIQYEVEVDCETYEGHYEPRQFDTNEEDNYIAPSSPTQSDSTINENRSSWQDYVDENKYYPWDLNEIKNCYQKINWRLFIKTLGTEIDSTQILDFVSDNNGFIITPANHWNTKFGGGFMVNHRKSKLNFYCSIVNKSIDENEIPDWRLVIVKYIPRLNQQSIAQDEERQRKIDRYWKSPK